MFLFAGPDPDAPASCGARILNAGARVRGCSLEVIAYTSAI
jgi:hypothetical protein